MEAYTRNKLKVLQALRDRRDISTLLSENQEECKKKLDKIIKQMLEGQENRFSDPDLFINEVVEYFLTYGPIAPELVDNTVSEIMVVGPQKIYVEVGGIIQRRSSVSFQDEEALLQTIKRISQSIGRSIDKESPMVDARLKDGSRVNAVIRPLAVDGPLLTIRKFNKTLLSCDDLIKIGALTQRMAQFLKLAVEHRLNMIISGATGSGKTTLLNVLSSFIPVKERIITIEDIAELSLNQEHIARLECRPGTFIDKEITIADLFKNSLRMRPDRIVIGECRSVEAFSMLQAMNTGHDGSLTTIHANSPRDSLSRLENMVLMAGYELPVKAIRFQIASAIEILIQTKRYSDGTRKISKITELTGMVNDVISLRDIFEFNQTGIDEKGKVIGTFESSGFIPEFFHRLKEQGFKPPMDMFRQDSQSRTGEKDRSLDYSDDESSSQVTKRRVRPQNM